MWLAIRIAVSLGALALLFQLIDFDSLVTTLRSVDLALYSTAVLALALSMPALGAWRWRQACKPTGVQLPYWAHLRIGMIGSFLGQALPTSVGVEATRAWLHSQETGSLSKSAAAVVADRLSGLITLLLLIVLCYPLQRLVIDSPAGRTLAAGLSAASLAGLAVLFSLSLPIGDRLIAIIPFEPVRRFASNLRTSFLDPSSTAILVGISLLLHAASLLGLWLIAKAIGASVSPLQLLVLIPPAFVVMLIPFSIAGWGLREGGFVVFLGLAGAPGDAALAISILFGAAMLLISLPGGGLFVFSKRRGETLPPRQESAPASSD